MILLKPFKDELFSSFIFRISRANHTNISAITNYIFRRRDVHIRDIDISNFSEKDLNQIKNHLAINIKNHQLKKYEGFLEESISTTSRHRWITTSNSNKFYKLFRASRFCPYCLNEKAYFKLDWRIMINNICTKHDSFLLNSCPKCLAKINYMHNDFFHEIYECNNCSFDLRKSKTTKLKKNSKYIYNQLKLNNILYHGYYKLNNQYYYSIGLFYLLRIIINIILRSIDKPLTYIEELQPKVLSKLISLSLFLLEGFPYRFNKFLKKKKMTNISFILSRNKEKQELIPNWFLAQISYKKNVFKGY